MVGFDGCIYLIDFSLAQYFHDNTSHIHTLLITGLDLVRTICYTSINSHMGLQQTQQDDLESLGYPILYLHLGKVPWQGISNRNPSRHCAAVLCKNMTFAKLLWSHSIQTHEIYPVCLITCIWRQARLYILSFCTWWTVIYYAVESVLDVLYTVLFLDTVRWLSSWNGQLELKSVQAVLYLASE